MPLFHSRLSMVLNALAGSGWQGKRNLGAAIPRRRALRLELLESRKLMTVLPLDTVANGEGESCPACGCGCGCNCSGATASDTGEFMLGRIAVTPILMESTGAASVYDWTPQQKADVLANLQEGLDWWKQLLATKSSVHTLDWVIDTTYLDTPVATSYEPIKRISNDYTRWVPDFLNSAGYNQAFEIDDNIRQFNNAQRTKHDTDWAFSVFIVNSDADDLFASGGQFSRAFAFAGGLYFVTPSNRPASTYAHETGHMFWARDEYPGGGNYFQRRGYYDSQNLNAVDLNPTPGFQQQVSIMSAGVTLDTAYNTLVTSQATLAQLGWQDSDGDGIFDVLDVPLEMNGVGQFDPASNEYRFQGSAKAKALPNRNSSGLQSDITLNKIGRVEYRLNGAGSWTTIVTPNAYQTNLDLRIPIPSGTTGTIEIRAIDPRIGMTSGVFQGSLTGFDATSTSGLNGFVWSDTINDGQRQLSEPGLKGWTVQIVDSSGSVVDFQTKVEPDLIPLGTVSADAYAGVTLRAVGNNADGSLAVKTDSRATTGTKVFVPQLPLNSSFFEGWLDDDQNLEARFTNLQASVSVDVFGLDAESYARLEAYSSSGVLLERIGSSALANGQSTTLVLNRSAFDIAYVVVKGHLKTRIGIDNLRFGAASQTVTGIAGAYNLRGLSAGTYNVKITPPTGYVGTSPISGSQSASVALGQATNHIDFGVFWTGSPWQNPSLNVDVNNDEVVAPIDVLVVINALTFYGTTNNLAGSPIPTTSLIDVNGDRALSPIDVLVVINYLARQNRSSAGEAGPSTPSFGVLSDQPDESADGEPADPEVAHLYTGDEEQFDEVVPKGSILVIRSATTAFSSLSPHPAPPSVQPFSRRRLLSSSAIDPSPAAVDFVMSQLTST